MTVVEIVNEQTVVEIVDGDTVVVVGTDVGTPGVPGSGGSVPDGGTTGQVLGKLSSIDGDADWIDQSASSGFTFTQDVPAALWLVAHNLAMFPNVTVVDTLLRVVEADVSYVDVDNLTIAFANPATGQAFLS